jgi:hypothetical protein
VPADQPPWAAFARRFDADVEDDDDEDRDDRDGRWARPPRPLVGRESLVPLIDAGLAFVHATQQVLLVAEGLLRDQRSRFEDPPPAPPSFADPDDRPRSERITFTD